MENSVNITENDGIEIVFAEKLPDELICKKCEQVLRLPKKLSCGHGFCGSCIEGLHTCPECSALIDHANLKRDIASQRRIQNLSVQCTFFDNGCEWKGVLRELEGHVLTCSQADMVCPRGCGIMYPKDQESIHLEYQCLKRTDPCPHCAQLIMIKNLKGHLKICSEVIIDCPNLCGLLQKSRKEIDEHLAKCPKADSVCPFGGCDFKGDGRKDLQKHIKDHPIKHLSILCDEIHDLKVKSTTAEKNSKNIESFLEAEKLQQSKMVWKIDSVNEKIQAAKNLVQPVIYSAPFLSGPNGYTMIMSACLNGDEGQNFGKKLSVFVKIVKGEFDATLLWPFTHRINFTLMEQNPTNPKHYSVDVAPSVTDGSEEFLSRPKDKENEAFGVAEFCDLTIMHKYIKDDSLIFQCEVARNNMGVL